MSIASGIRKQRWSAVTLALLLQAAVAAPAISRMTCLLGGHVSYTVGYQADCCPDDHPTDRPSVGATCCDLSMASPLKADYVQHAPPALDEALASVDVAFFTRVSPAMPAQPHWLESRPPPLPVLERLADISSFLI